VKADEKTASSSPPGLVVTRTGKGGEVANVPWKIRCGSIRYNGSRRKGVCQALNSDVLAPRKLTRADFVNEARAWVVGQFEIFLLPEEYITNLIFDSSIIQY